MDPDDAAGRARQRDLVRRGYDAISLAYRGDDGQAPAAPAAPAASGEDVSRYAGWVAELAGLLPPGARVVDLGCGAGIPATRELAGHGLQVIGVDFSAVQLRRARRLVPAASLIQADMTALQLRPASADAVVSLYALIHVPLADQQALFPVDGDPAVSRRRHVLGPRRRRDLPPLVRGGPAHAPLEPLRPRRGQRP
jgi:SAM-dependent methyltransferase